MTEERDSHPRTVDQAAVELNVSKSTIRAWIAQGRIGFIRLGRAVRVPANEIRRVLEEGWVPPVSCDVERLAHERRVRLNGQPGISGAPACSRGVVEARRREDGT